MNAQLDNPSPLPSRLDCPPAPMERRRHIGRHLIDRAALARFNSLLLRLDLGRRPITSDQLASTARKLLDTPTGWNHASASIRRSMRRAGAIDLMLHDDGWMPTDAVIAPAQLVVRYVRDTGDLIPDALPRVGRLDDAIVVDVAWPVLRGEVDDYLDFRRMRRVERGLGNGHRFDRTGWEQARNAEAALFEHCRRVGESSYVDGHAISRFRVV